MSKRRSILIASLIVLLLAASAAVVVWLGRPKKTAVTIEVTGTRGLAIKGTCEVDGNSRDLAGEVPTERGRALRFDLEGYRMTYSLSTEEDSGEFRVRTAVGDRALAPGGSGNPPKRVVRGWVQSAWWWSPPSYWIESRDKDEQKEWLQPPPP
jgi:hypothetical protein